MKIFISIVAVIVVALALATSVMAQSSQDGYTDNKGQIQAHVDNGGPSGGGTTPFATSTDSGGSLPFTGLDVAILAAAGGVLTGAGLGMRRLTRAHGSA